MEVVMVRDKNTKNAVRYKDVAEPGKLNIYLPKDEVVKLDNPETIAVTIVKVN